MIPKYQKKGPLSITLVIIGLSMIISDLVYLLSHMSDEFDPNEYDTEVVPCRFDPAKACPRRCLNHSRQQRDIQLVSDYAFWVEGREDGICGWKIIRRARSQRLIDQLITKIELSALDHSLEARACTHRRVDQRPGFDGDYMLGTSLTIGGNTYSLPHNQILISRN